MLVSKMVSSPTSPAKTAVPPITAAAKERYRDMIMLVNLLFAVFYGQSAGYYRAGRIVLNV